MKHFIRISIVLGLLLFQPLHAQEEPMRLNFADTIFTLTAYTAFHVSLALAHELGHIVAAQIFIKCGAPIVQDQLPGANSIPHSPALGGKTDYAPNTPQTALTPTTPISFLGQYPEFQSSWLNALVHLAGPLSGIAASYIALKATNIIQELNTNENLKIAIKKGLKKQTFNADQPSGVRGLVFAHMLFNSLSLIPSSSYQFESEGEKIRQCFFRK